MSRFLFDEGLPYRATHQLAAAGWNVVHVRDISLAGAPDPLILIRAREEGRIVITLDHDYHQHLALTRATAPSVLLVRVEELNGEAALTLLPPLLSEVVRQAEGPFAASATCAADLRIRALPLR